MNKKAVFIVGPTASGKTDLGVFIAKRFNGEVISADSMQIYKGIHIASAAPDEDEKQGIPHHMLEFLRLDESFSVADYVTKARTLIDDINARGKLPVIVGGTGLYISSLLDNTVFSEEKADPELRKSLENEFEVVGAQEMLRRLSEFDPESAARLHPSDKRRIIRCFEIYRSSGKTLSEQNLLSHLQPPDFDFTVMGVSFEDREKLYQRINLRVDIMLEKGLLEEAEKTYCKASGKGAFQAIGHKELYGYISGETPLAEAVQNLKMQTRRYAKRQLTWFRRDQRIIWLFRDGQDPVEDKAEKIVYDFING